MGGDSLHCCYREQVAYAFYDRFRVPKLYKMANSVMDWADIPSRCQTHPKEILHQHKYAPNDTALHRLTKQPVVQTDDIEATRQLQLYKKEAVEAILQRQPSVVHVTDAFGRTPLHLACMEVSDDSEEDICSDTAIAMFLLEQHPRAAELPDVVEHRTPLHYLVARCSASVPIALLNRLIELAPEALKMPDTTSETPLNIVERRMDEITNAKEVLQILLQQPR